MKIIKKISLIFFVMLLVFGFTGKKSKQSKTESKTFRSLMSKADTVIVSKDSVTFTDDSGRKELLTIKKNPKKVAVLYGSHSILWMECGGKISVGLGGKSMSELFETQVGRDVTKDPDFLKITNTTTNPKNWNIEALLAANPDLIICTKEMNGYQTICAPASQLNIPIIAIAYNGIEDYLKWSKVFTALNNREDLFEKNAIKVARGVANIIDAIPNNKKVSVLSLLPTGKGIKAEMPRTNIGAMLDDLKAVNAATTLIPDFKSTRLDINMEQIYKLDPEIIFIPVQKDDHFAKKYFDSTLASSPIWAELQAVKNGQVYFLPKKYFLFRPNKEYLEAYKMLAELLYPEIKF